MWNQVLTLRVIEKNEIENGSWLSDVHMYAASKLLAKQFPHLKGLQNTVLCQNGGFKSVSSDGKEITNSASTEWFLLFSFFYSCTNPF